MRKSKIICDMVEATTQIIYRKSTLEGARRRDADFTRQRVMGFSDLLSFILQGVRSSTTCALRRYFDKVGEKKKHMTQQALSRARAKFDHMPFETMVRETVEMYYSGEYTLKRWEGYLPLAVDSSTANLPDDPAVLAHFGGSGRNGLTPMARISLLYDVANSMILDAAIEGIGCGERELAARHMERFDALCKVDKAVFLFDRGYPSADLLEDMQANGRLFLMRMSKSCFTCVQEAREADQIVRHPCGMDLRVVRLKLSTGEEECLITNLYDLPYAQFGPLYFMRWPIETEYSLLKEKLVLEDFSGRSLNVILQDFWACVHVANLCAAVKEEADAKVKKQREGKKNKYTYAANMNEIIGLMRDNLVAALARPSALARTRRMNALVKLATQSVVPIRPGRSSPRPAHPRVAKARFNSKRNL